MRRSKFEEYTSTPILVWLIESGIIFERGDGWVCSRYRLRWVFGLWLFSDYERPNAAVYFGEDSIGLIGRLDAQRDERVLDLCCGPGAAALHSAMRGAIVTGLDVSEEAGRVLMANAEINGFADRVSFVRGAAFTQMEPLGAFDCITMNPPLLPVPTGVAFPLVGNGGADGLDFLVWALEVVGASLTSNGRFHAVGAAMANESRIVGYERLQRAAQVAGLQVAITIASRVPIAPGSPFFEGWSATSRAVGGVDASDAFARLVSENSADAMVFFGLFARRGSPGVRVFEALGTSGMAWFA